MSGGAGFLAVNFCFRFCYRLTYYHALVAERAHVVQIEELLPALQLDRPDTHAIVLAHAKQVVQTVVGGACGVVAAAALIYISRLGAATLSACCCLFPLWLQLKYNSE